MKSKMMLIGIIIWSIIFVLNIFIEPTKFLYGMAILLIIFYIYIIDNIDNKAETQTEQKSSKSNNNLKVTL